MHWLASNLGWSMQWRRDGAVVERPLLSGSQPLFTSPPNFSCRGHAPLLCVSPGLKILC